MGKPIPMVELWRGGLLESTHLGHAVLVDDTGQIVQAWGDPERIIFPRSSCKMIQALPLVESGAADAFGLTTAQLAVYTGAAAAGTAIKTAYALTGNTTAAKVVVTAATSTDAVTGTPLYIRNTTAQGAAATADVFIYGYDLSFLP